MDYFDILLARKLANKGDITTESLSVTENGTYTAPSGKAYTPVTVSVQPPANSYQLKSITTPTSLATFEASAMPMPSLKVSVEAQQDLHGYDKPWVAGAGKNKFGSGNMHDTTLNNVSFTLNDDGSVKVNGTASATTSVYFFGGSSTYEDIGIPSGDYIVSGGTENVCFYLVRMRNGETESLQVYRTEKALNIQDGDTFRVFLRVANGATASNEVAKPMIRLSTETDATFAPYSNICPISGWDAANVSDVGKNWFNKNSVNYVNAYVSLGSGTLTLGASEYSIYLWLPKGTYAFQRIIPSTDTTTKRFRVRRYDNVPQVGDVGDVVADYNDELTGTFTTNKDGYVLIFMFNGQSAWDGRQEVFNSLQIETGDTATTYEPYNGVTTTISLPQTVYGGELDVVNGVLKITDGYIASYNGETLPSTWISSMDVYAEGTTPTTGAEVCYELAEPIIIPLTPTLIKSLNGTNNLSVDCGEIIEGEYFIALTEI